MFYGNSSSSAVPWVGPWIESPAVDLGISLTIISGSIIAATPHASVTIHEWFTMSHSEVPTILSVIAPSEHYTGKKYSEFCTFKVIHFDIIIINIHKSQT